MLHSLRLAPFIHAPSLLTLPADPPCFRCCCGASTVQAALAVPIMNATSKHAPSPNLLLGSPELQRNQRCCKGGSLWTCTHRA